MKTITLPGEITFTTALDKLMSGECIGIRPDGNSNYVELYKPGWMSKKSPDYMLRWNGSTSDATSDANIRSNQYLGVWNLVIVDHRTLS